MNPKPRPCYQHSRRAGKWNQGEAFLDQIINSYPVTSCFPSEKVEVLLCDCSTKWSFSVGFLKLFSKIGHEYKACSQQLAAPSFLRNKVNICNEGWNIPGVFKLTTLTSRIIRFQRQKKKNQGDIHCMDQMMRKWGVIWDSFTRKSLKGFHMNRTIRVGNSRLSAQLLLSDVLEDLVFRPPQLPPPHWTDSMKFSNLSNGMVSPGRLAGHRICTCAWFWLSNFSNPVKMLHSIKLIAEKKL